MAKFHCDNGHTYLVPDNSCPLCDKCELLWDYTNGPYAILCTEGKETEDGLEGRCKYFSEVKDCI